MKLLPCLLCLVMVLPCFAFPADVAYVSGVVTNSVSGLPVDGATVSATGDQAQEPVVTGVHGTFTLELRKGIEPGSLINIRVQKTGYHTYVDQVAVAPSLTRTIQLVPLALPKKPSTKKLVHITFKNAPELTPLRKRVITRDISGVHDYFASLEIPVPNTIPPFTVTNGFGSYTPPLEYRGDLNIPRALIKDRKAATYGYVAYVMQRAVPDKGGPFYQFYDPDFPLHEELRIMICSGLRDYFQSSYWGESKSEEPLTLILWKIRAALGKSFADRLASYVLRIMADTPQEILDQDMKVSFTKALRIADGILEANRQSWPTIQGIIDHSKVDFMFTIQRGYGPIAPPQ